MGMLYQKIDITKKKQRMARWCRYCQRKFIPTGEFNDKCEDCINFSYQLKNENMDKFDKKNFATVVMSHYWPKEKIAKSMVESELLRKDSNN